MVVVFTSEKKVFSRIVMKAVLLTCNECVVSLFYHFLKHDFILAKKKKKKDNINGCC